MDDSVGGAPKPSTDQSHRAPRSLEAALRQTTGKPNGASSQLAQNQKLHPRAWLEPQAMNLETRQTTRPLSTTADAETARPVRAMDGQNSPEHCCKWQRISTRISRA